MQTLNMVLNNGTEITLSEVNFPLHIVVQRETKEQIMAIWDQLTPEALERVTFQDSGETIFTFRNCSVTGEQIVVNYDGSLTGHYYLEGEREPNDYETAGRIMMGEVE